MDERSAFVSGGINGWSHILRGTPVSIILTVAHINIVAAINAWTVAGKIQISFIRRKGRCGFPEFRIKITAQVLRRAPTLVREIGDVEITASVRVRKITACEEKPLTVLRNIQCAFIIIAVDISDQGFCLRPTIIQFVRFVEILVGIIHTPCEDQGFSVQRDGRIIFSNRGIDAVSQVLRFEFIKRNFFFGRIVQCELVGPCPVCCSL